MGLLTLCAHNLPCRYCRALRSIRAACLLHLWHSSGLSTAQRRLNFAANALRTTLIVQAVCLREIPCCRDGTRKLRNLHILAQQTNMFTCKLQQVHVSDPACAGIQHFRSGTLLEELRSDSSQ